MSDPTTCPHGQPGGPAACPACEILSLRAALAAAEERVREAEAKGSVQLQTELKLTRQAANSAEQSLAKCHTSLAAAEQRAEEENLRADLAEGRERIERERREAAEQERHEAYMRGVKAGESLAGECCADRRRAESERDRLASLLADAREALTLLSKDAHQVLAVMPNPSLWSAAELQRWGDRALDVLRRLRALALLDGTPEKKP